MQWMLLFFVLSSFMHPSTTGEDIQKIDMMLEEEEMAIMFFRSATEKRRYSNMQAEKRYC
ncbi:hypothetical protein [Anoxybacillus sp. KU2-6(11)]|uniref:hypothetical protein n=1 Tax=Anoxybacillus sp. KU2-6(11) TaxID=1535751 RepID=UPI001E391C87|nr:hypothetical protein [Anoxybacillus sp. KU2-6(11)]